ncbi:MAG: hypothetical protein WAN46_12380 [Gammaproteobacteria bacterium]
MCAGHPSNNLLFLSGLGEFLRPTPSAVVKLLAAWDALQTETHVFVLAQLCSVDLPAHLAKRICLKALDSPNAYVRYLAGAKLYSKLEEAADKTIIKAKIEADPEPLVHYCLLESAHQNEGYDDRLEDAEKFFALPQEARLAMVRNLAGAGKQIAGIIGHGLRSRVASDVELLEILCDYVNNSYSQTRCSQIDWRDPSSHADWEIGQDLEALWRLVPMLPNAASKLLIKQLPERAGFSFEIPHEVLDSFTDEQAIWLLERPDIEVKALRKAIALGREGRDKPVRISAMKHNFDLSYQEFSALIFDAKQVRTSEANLTPLDLANKEKIHTLQELASGAEHLSPVLYQALRDLLLETPLTIRGAPHAAGLARQRLHRWLEDHHEQPYEQQRRELRLYRLAKEAVPWNRHRKGYKPAGELSFLGDKVEEGDTWATFRAFSEAWKDSGSARLDKYLPRLHEIGEISIATDDEESGTVRLVEATQQIEGRFNEILDILRQSHDQKDNDSKRVTELEKTLRALQDEAVASRKALEPLNARLGRMEKLDRIRVALFIVLALLTVVLLSINAW